MAGTLIANTINTDTAGAVFTTQNAVTGIAKAWLNYNGSTQTITGSFNVSSVTYNAQGDYTVNFTTAMPNANYSAVAQASTLSGEISLGVIGMPYLTPQTTTSIRLGLYNYNSGVLYNHIVVSVAIFSS